SDCPGGSWLCTTWSVPKVKFCRGARLSVPHAGATWTAVQPESGTKRTSRLALALKKISSPTDRWLLMRTGIVPGPNDTGSSGGCTPRLLASTLPSSPTSTQKTLVELGAGDSE